MFKSNKKIIYLAGLITLSFLSIMLLSLKAKANSSDLSGSCGAVFGLSNPAEALWEFANNSVDDEGINAISVINFDNSTMSYEITRLVITAPSTGEWRRTTFNNVTFTVSTHPSIPKIKIITLTNGEIFNLLPINGKKTYLIQGVTFGSTGVCSEL